MPKTLYLTFNDPPSGIYKSQVVDVVRFYREHLGVDARLVAFISMRKFGVNKKRIQTDLPDAVVLPMVPGVRNWRLNGLTLILLRFLLRPEVVIARSVLATVLAMRAMPRCRIVYDGRGAIAAEWKEYNVVGSERLMRDIAQLEKHAVLRSDFRIAVSHKLVDYWQKTYGYEGSMHAVIPCTLNTAFTRIPLSEDSILAARYELGLAPTDIVIAYSGSVAGWQGFSILADFLKRYLLGNPQIKVLFLSPLTSETKKLMEGFPGQVIIRHVEPAHVPEILIAADYGLLIREQSITNMVASPVKFAEYLACGLKVIISPYIGDYAEFVEAEGGGVLTDENFEISKMSYREKVDVKELSLRFFTKERYREQYRQILGGESVVH